MQRSDPISPSPLLAIACLAVFAALLLMPYFHGHWRLADDSYEFALPALRFQQRVLALGQWPHWNLGEGFGKPTAINSGSMFFYPFAPLWGWLVGWSETSYLSFLFLHLFAGAGLAYCFSRKVGLTLEASVFFALAFIGNSYALGFFSNFSLLIPYLFWPLLGEGLWRLHQSRGAWRTDSLAVAQIAGATVLIETSGYPLTKLLIYLSTAAAALPLLRRHYKPLFVSAGIAALCTAPEWATALRALPLSERMGTDIYGDISYGSPTNFLSLGTLLVPTAFLARDVFQLGMTWLERSWWVGALTLALPLWAYQKGVLFLGRYKRFAIISLAGMLFAFGGHSFFRELSSLAIPLIEHLRFANMGRVIPMTFLIFLGAAGLDALQGKGAPRKPDLKARRRISLLWVAFLLACLAAALSEQESGAGSARLYLDPATQWTLGALHTSFYLLLAYSAYSLNWSLGPRMGWAAVIVLIQFLSLADVGYAFRHLVSKESPAGLRPAEENFIPASPQPNVRSLRQWTDGDDWVHWDGNTKVFFAYTVPFHRWMRTAFADQRVGKFAATLASCQDDAAQLGVQPGLAGAHSCAGTQFRIDRYYGNTIELSGSNSAPMWMMVHDFVDPDWHAELNGKAVPILTAYGLLKAVELPAGQNWNLRFEYRHPWFPWLAWLSALGFALLFLSCSLSLVELRK